MAMMMQARNERATREREENGWSRRPPILSSSFFSSLLFPFPSSSSSSSFSLSLFFFVLSSLLHSYNHRPARNNYVYINETTNRPRCTTRTSAVGSTTRFPTIFQPRVSKPPQQSSRYTVGREHRPSARRAWIGQGSRSSCRATGIGAAVAWPSACPSSACFASRVRLARRTSTGRGTRPRRSRPIARARTRLRIFLCLVTGSGS